jgi:hypothetical protein
VTLLEAARALDAELDQLFPRGPYGNRSWDGDAWRSLRSALSEPVEASQDDLPAGFPYTVPGEEYARGYRAGMLFGVENAARQVDYHCDCTHADVPGIVRLLTDPTNPLNVLNDLAPLTPAAPPEPKEKP